MESAQYLRELLTALKGVRYEHVKQLCDKTGISQGNLSAFLHGKRQNLNFDTVWKLFRALGLEFPEIPEEGGKNPGAARSGNVK